MIATRVVMLPLLLCWWLLGCQPCPQIVADITVSPDGGAAMEDAGAYCTAECTADVECAQGMYCDFNPHLTVDGVPESHGFCIRAAGAGK